MLYELRHYDIESSRGLEQVAGRFDDHILQIWKRLGIEPVGFWSVIIGTPIPRLTYLLAWEDLGQRQMLWDAFDADPEWQQIRRDKPTPPGAAVPSTHLRRLFSSQPTTPGCRASATSLPAWPAAFSSCEPTALTTWQSWRRRWNGSAAKAALPLIRTASLRWGSGQLTIGVTPPPDHYALVREPSTPGACLGLVLYRPRLALSVRTAFTPGGNCLFTRRYESCVMKGTEFSGWK